MEQIHWTKNKRTISQKVIKEAEVGKYLTQEWTFVTQLKSGEVIVQKGITVENVANIRLEQAKRQMLKE